MRRAADVRVSADYVTDPLSYWQLRLDWSDAEGQALEIVVELREVGPQVSLAHPAVLLAVETLCRGLANWQAEETAPCAR